jgi:hypothetical protein
MIPSHTQIARLPHLPHRGGQASSLSASADRSSQ